MSKAKSVLYCCTYCITDLFAYFNVLNIKVLGEDSVWHICRHSSGNVISQRSQNGIKSGGMQRLQIIWQSFCRHIPDLHQSTRLWAVGPFMTLVWHPIICVKLFYFHSMNSKLFCQQIKKENLCSFVLEATCVLYCPLVSLLTFREKCGCVIFVWS